MKYLDIVNGYGSLTKMFRIALQPGVLAAGAYLLIMNQATAGIIIAGSILSARALAPVETAIAKWKGFAAVLQSRRRLEFFLNEFESRYDDMRLQLTSHTEQLSEETHVNIAATNDGLTLIDQELNSLAPLYEKK